MTNKKALQTISKRQQKQKGQIVEKLKKIPIVQIACEQLGIGRATYYRWRKEDSEFEVLADQALDHGRKFINDLAESKLLSQIRDQNMTAIIFWLKHNHTQYGNRLEVTTSPKENAELSDEQMKLITEALKLGSLLPVKNKKNETPNTK